MYVFCQLLSDRTMARNYTHLVGLGSAHYIERHARTVISNWFESVLNAASALKAVLLNPDSIRIEAIHFWRWIETGSGR